MSRARASIALTVAIALTFLTLLFAPARAHAELAWTAPSNHQEYGGDSLRARDTDEKAKFERDDAEQTEEAIMPAGLELEAGRAPGDEISFGWLTQVAPFAITSPVVPSKTSLRIRTREASPSRARAFLMVFLI